ncbi:MAG: tetratricopeptide repeat protein [Proteobacteria bacterium]|nr:tetratricopeptide repeat protein [Pseudomonadota bacterium]
MLERKLNAQEDVEAAQATRLQIAAIYEEQLEDLDSAVGLYEKVLEADEENIAALKGLERLYGKTQRWQELLGVLERMLVVGATEKEQIGLLERMATMWADEFRKPDRAAERLEQIVDIDPMHLPTLEALSKLNRSLQRWDRLVETYERHIAATPDRGKKIELYCSIGDVYSKELKDTDRAIDAYLNILALDDRNSEALDSLATFYDRQGEPAQALDYMQQLSTVISDPDRLVSLHFRMGQILDGQMGDRKAALEAFERAVEIKSDHLPALQAMVAIHRDAGEWRAAARVLERAAEIDQSDRQVSALHVELGRIYDDQLDEHDRGIESFERALARDSDNEEAALPLVDEYAKHERWQAAEPLLEMLVRRGTEREHGERQELWYKLAICERELNNDDKAIRAYAQAYELDKTHLPSLWGLAATYYRTQDWDHAFKYFQTLLVHHRDELDGPEITEVFHKLGVVKLKQGDHRKALNMFDKALEEDGYHRPTLEALVEAHEKVGDFQQVVHFKKRILEVAEESERFDMLVRIGDLWKEKLNAAPKAIDAYEEAATLRPQDHRVLHKLLSLYQITRQWERTIEIIERVSELEQRPEAKGKYAYTVGVIVRDELKDPERAISHFDAALDADPMGQLKAFEAINRLATQQKDWKGLERAYRKMLHRVTGKGDVGLEFNLWHALGVIYRDRQRNFEAAAEAFKMASSLQPDNMQEHQILAEIYAAMPSRINDAIAEHQKLLRADPYRVDSYRHLYKLYFDARAYDKAWCVAATARFLQKADNQQLQFYEQYKSKGPIRPSSRLSNELWLKDLFHPGEDPLVGKLFEGVAPAVLKLKHKSDKQWGLNRKQQVTNFAGTTLTFARTFGFVAQVLGLPFTPRLFVCPDRQGGLAYVATSPPASVCGSALLSGFSPNDLMFVVGRHLAYYRGEHFIRTLFASREELKLVLLAAMRLAGVDIQDKHVEQWAAQIRKGTEPADHHLLVSVGKRLLQGGAKTDLKRWMQSVEITACRAGLLMCDDLEIASRMIQADPGMPGGDLNPRDKVRELVLFSTADEYFRLREALGTRINIG